MSIILFYSTQVLLYSIIPILIASYRNSFRLVYAYIYTGLLLVMAGFLGAVYSFPLSESITISAGSLAYGALMISTIIFVIIEKDLRVVRHIIGIVILVDIFKFFLFSNISWALQSAQVVNPFATSAAVFGVSARTLLAGGVLIVLELILLVFLLERIKFKLRNSALFSMVYGIIFIGILCLDGILFPLLVTPLDPALSGVIAGNVQTKLVLALSYSIPLLFFQVVFRKRISEYERTSLQLRDLFDLSRIELIRELGLRQEALEQHREQIRFHSNLINSVGEAVMATDLEGQITFWNAAAEKIYGWESEEVLGKNILDVTPTDASGTEAAEIMSSLLQGHTWQGEFELARKNGETFPALVTDSPLTDRDGNLIGIIGVSHDISERKRAEDALKERNYFIETILDKLPLGVAVNYAQDGTTSYMNSEFERIYGWPHSEVTDVESFFDKVYPDPEYRRQIQERVMADIQSGDPERMHWEDVEITTRDGRKRIIDAKNIPLLEQNLMISTVQDITERKLAEKMLEESERKYRYLVETSHDLIWSVDAKGYITYINQASERIYGYKPHELIGRHWTEISWELDIKDSSQIAQEVLAQGGTAQGRIIEMRHRDGHKVILHANAVQIFDENGVNQGAVGSSHDITGILEYEEEIRRSREQFRALTNHLQAAIEEERAHLSRELHDEFGQILTGLKMDLSMLERRIEMDADESARIQAMRALLDQAIDITRRIASELRPGILDDLGLLPALEWLSSEFSRRSDLNCVISLPSEEPELDPRLKTIIFRIFQEALTNVMRHAQASRVVASFAIQEEEMCMQIRDNGRGIRPDEIEGTKSLGLLGMRERAASWNGTVEIRGEEGGGTTVIVCIPLAARRPESSSFG